MAKQESHPLIRQTREEYGDSWRSDLFEQYKMYVESADKISERRTAANNYLLTVNTGLVTLYGLATQPASTIVWHITVPIAGILASFVWWWLIQSYRDLNTVKFKVIHELENYLPVALYDHEWKLAEQGRGKSYRPVSHLEGLVPFIFMALYVLLATPHILGLLKCLR
jgi:hypothetical protein